MSELLAAAGPRVGAPLAHRVTYDAPCHLQHAQRVAVAPLAVLDAIPGLERVALVDSDQCCGSAGIYNLLEPALSAAVLAPKLAHIELTGASLVATGNPGCLMQIGAGLRRAGQSRAHDSPGRAARRVVRGAGAYAAIAHSGRFVISLPHDRVAVLRSRRRAGRNGCAAARGARSARSRKRGSRPPRSMTLEHRCRRRHARCRAARTAPSRDRERRDGAHADRAPRRSPLRVHSCTPASRSHRARASSSSTRSPRCRLAIVTGLERATVDSLLSLAELDGAFEVIIAAEDVASAKPAPDGYRKALDRMHRRRAARCARAHSRSSPAPPGHEPRAPPDLRCAIVAPFRAESVADADAMLESLAGETLASLDAMLPIEAAG